MFTRGTMGTDAKSSGFYDKYPYFAKLTIPANTYNGVDYDTPSFQDSTLWVANDKMINSFLNIISDSAAEGVVRSQERVEIPRLHALLYRRSGEDIKE